MSGPALSRLDSHRAIHESSRYDAADLTEILERAITKGDDVAASQITCLLIEHWQSRTLRHAQMEEEGLYVEALERHLDLSTLIVSLKRDHDLMRKLIAEIEDLLGGAKWAQIVTSFQTLAWIEKTHSFDEETKLVYELMQRSTVVPETAS